MRLPFTHRAGPGPGIRPETRKNGLHTLAEGTQIFGKFLRGLSGILRTAWRHSA